MAKPSRKRVQSRAESMSADEVAAGSDDPLRQAEQILSESDARVTDRAASADEPGENVEHRQSQDTVEPAD